jgi:hypothetical protein
MMKGIKTYLAQFCAMFRKPAPVVDPLQARIANFERREEKRQRSLIEYSYTLRLKKKSKAGFTLPM